MLGIVHDQVLVSKIAMVFKYCLVLWPPALSPIEYNNEI